MAAQPGALTRNHAACHRRRQPRGSAARPMRHGDGRWSFQTHQSRDPTHPRTNDAAEPCLSWGSHQIHLANVRHKDNPLRGIIAKTYVVRHRIPEVVKVREEIVSSHAHQRVVSVQRKQNVQSGAYASCRQRGFNRNVCFVKACCDCDRLLHAGKGRDTITHSLACTLTERHIRRERSPRIVTFKVLALEVVKHIGRIQHASTGVMVTSPASTPSPSSTPTPCRHPTTPPATSGTSLA
jgi:hypothetical protein